MIIGQDQMSYPSSKMNKKHFQTSDIYRDLTRKAIENKEKNVPEPFDAR
jgi:hypothetical protein